MEPVSSEDSKLESAENVVKNGLLLLITFSSHKIYIKYVCTINLEIFMYFMYKKIVV